MNHHITADGRAAVSADTYWLPIDDATPRNVKVLAIAKDLSGILSVAEIHTHETWYTHWHPLPRFKQQEPA